MQGSSRVAEIGFPSAALRQLLDPLLADKVDQRVHDHPAG